MSKSSNSICAFCTTATDNKAVGVLQQFNSDFINNPLFQLSVNTDGGNHSTEKHHDSLLDYFSVCVNCLPQLQLLLASKQKVDKVDSEVRYLQKRILAEMKCLLEEVDKMCGEMVMIEGIIRSNPVVPPVSRRICVKKKKRGRKSTKLIAGGVLLVQFRQNIFNVLQDLQKFRVGTSSKLLMTHLKISSNLNQLPSTISSFQVPSVPSNSEINQVPLPIVKMEIDDEVEMETEDNFFSSPPTSPSPSSPSNALPQEDESQPSEGKRDLQSSDEEDAASADDDDDDEDFEVNPQKRISVKVNKKISKYSNFRKALISRIREGSTTTTSANLPASKSDPRRPYCIKYNFNLNQFSLNDILIDCLDLEETLQCSQCNFSINSKTSCRGDRPERNIEDWMFDHILANHLNAYICKHCGMSSQSGKGFMLHSKSHEMELMKFFCDICERPLTSKSGVKQHKWTHLSEEEKKEPQYQSGMPRTIKQAARLEDGPGFQCETCGKVFKHERALKAHEIIHEDPEKREKEKVMCTDCGKTVFLKYLRSHQRKWCEKVRGPKKGLDCKVCGENLRTLKLLHIHLKERHPGEKVWDCEICGKSFKKKPDLAHHQVLHKEEKKFLCQRCGRGFKQKKNCRRHEGTCKERGGGGERNVGDRVANNLGDGGNVGFSQYLNIY